jgi:hypothetical protein
LGVTLQLDRATAEATAPVWEKVKNHVTPLEWPDQARLITEINALKKERDAVILAHNYMTPEIYHGVGDYVGDSLGLAKEAARSDARVIVQAAVRRSMTGPNRRSGSLRASMTIRSAATCPQARSGPRARSPSSRRDRRGGKGG